MTEASKGTLTDYRSAYHIHKTVPVQVWVDVDEGIAEVVRHLNTIEGIRTYSSCQGTTGDAAYLAEGRRPYEPYVLVSWEDDAARDRLEAFACYRVHREQSEFLGRVMLRNKA